MKSVLIKNKESVASGNPSSRRWRLMSLPGTLMKQRFWPDLKLMQRPKVLYLCSISKTTFTGWGTRRGDGLCEQWSFSFWEIVLGWLFLTATAWMSIIKKMELFKSCLLYFSCITSSHSWKALWWICQPRCDLFTFWPTPPPASIDKTNGYLASLPAITQETETPILTYRDIVLKKRQRWQERQWIKESTPGETNLKGNSLYWNVLVKFQFIFEVEFLSALPIMNASSPGSFVEETPHKCQITLNLADFHAILSN